MYSWNPEGRVHTQGCTHIQERTEGLVTCYFQLNRRPCSKVRGRADHKLTQQECVAHRTLQRAEATPHNVLKHSR